MTEETKGFKISHPSLGGVSSSLVPGETKVELNGSRKR